ncbi:hypothetical protein C7974DRAFT_29310 [Boeremia exigua]|uniref:uncharacterized protein n=1 Tax=Boeremia exigua TaxID=749465 RepID=UPI001E8D6716|nr:uncharacterized protein C7974DRAFT_29310 [Boeremia exigua]KAH6644870.1 hypothetical protein C7974DRAFT_29310 [Boeremia exigua]
MYRHPTDEGGHWRLVKLPNLHGRAPSPVREQTTPPGAPHSKRTIDEGVLTDKHGQQRDFRAVFEQHAVVPLQGQVEQHLTGKEPSQKLRGALPKSCSTRPTRGWNRPTRGRVRRTEVQMRPMREQRLSVHLASALEMLQLSIMQSPETACRRTGDLETRNTEQSERLRTIADLQYELAQTKEDLTKHKLKLDEWYKCDKKFGDIFESLT